MTFTLLLTSIIVLSTSHVSVQVIEDKVTGLTKAECEVWMKAWRAKGPRYQASCVKEVQ